MDLSMTYTNHRGETVTIADGGTLHLMKGKPFDHEWSFEQGGQRVWGLRLDARKLVLPLGTFGGSLAGRTRLYEVLEADALAAELGTLAFHGYELRCIPVAAALDAWWFADGIEERDVTLMVPRPLWCRDVTHEYLPDPDQPSQGEGDLDYAHDYTHDYTWAAGTSRTLRTGAVGDAEFMLRVWGPASNPSVTIAGNTYAVYVEVPYGSRLELDTRDRTVELIDVSGGVANCYASRIRGRRGSGSYAFQPLPPGDHEVLSNGTFGFDVVVHDERTEPAWDA